MRSSIVRISILVALTGLLASACTKSSSDASGTTPPPTVSGSNGGPSPGPSSTASGTSTASATSGPSGSSTSTPTATGTPASPIPPPTCTASFVTVIPGVFHNGPQTDSGTFVYTNNASGPCWMEGYPTMQMLDGGGSEMKTKVVHGSNASVPAVPVRRFLLRPAQSASFFYGYVAVPTGTQKCPSSSKVEVGVPGTETTVTVTFGMAPCGGTITVSAVKAGAILS